MSDEIDLHQSHLCTTEDAFEKFQSVSMYEENEYITLSDIVPPPPEAPDQSAELNNIPYENEVVLDSNLEEQVPEVNSTIEISADDNSASETPLPPVEHREKVEELPFPITTTNESRPSRRGRKKQIQQNELISTCIDYVQKPNETSIIQNQDNEAIPSTPSTQRKRGRPPKNVIQSQEKNVTVETSFESTETPTDMPKRANRGKLPNKLISQNNNGLQNDNSPLKKYPGRRGRPKKIISDQPIATDKIEINNETNSHPVEKHVPKKRGRKKKTVVQDESIKDVEETKESDQPRYILEDPQPIETPATVAPMKTYPAKRGRPKKVHTNEKSCTKTIKPEESRSILVLKDDDDGDDICLSQLKNTLEDSKEPTEDITPNLQDDSKNNGIESSDLTIEITEETVLEVTEQQSPEIEEVPLENTQKDIKVSAKRNTKQPVMDDFEYNIDSILSESLSESKEEAVKPENQLPVTEITENKESLLVEDTSKRPVRRKTKQLHYDEGSDEDPFANVELSDEDDMRGRKGRYYSDDEYIPGVSKKRGSKHMEVSGTDTSDSDIDNIHDEIMLGKRKRTLKSDGTPCKKRGRKSKEEIVKAKTLGRFSPDVSTIKPNEKSLVDDDVEFCLETSVIKASEESKNVWGASNEFENFLVKKIQGTNLKIKKASTPVQPLDIPVIDPNEAKKTIEISTQTPGAPTTSTGIQTTTPYDVPMKENVTLTTDQSEKACEFLKSIVKTTAELGELMTQKSEDFIKKKINTSHVTDTFKMDYCVKKSFLLFKLAKHNLMQMEEDLTEQYDMFLRTHNLSQYREKPKVLEAELKARDSDSDCEIIETPAPQKPKTSSKTVPFNPKTVFLNKELSIKIAKKPTDDKKLNIEGRHTVWINDSVMVKKVKPTQSFLAQDSRNKKPPDCVTIEMVSAFFKQYYRQKAIVTCAPFVSSEWVARENIYVCNYFFAKSEDFPSTTGLASSSGPCEDTEDNIAQSDLNDNICPLEKKYGKSNPTTLFSLCTQVLQNYLTRTSSRSSCPLPEMSPEIVKQNPATLYRLCLDSINTNILNEAKDLEVVYCTTPPPLTTLCCKMIIGLLCTNTQSVIDNRSDSPLRIPDYSRPDSPKREFNDYMTDDLSHSRIKLTTCWNFREFSVKSLFALCLDSINIQLGTYEEDDMSVCKLAISNITYGSKDIKVSPESLKSIAYKCIVNLIYIGDSNLFEISEKYPRPVKKKVKSLADICFEIVTRAFADNDNQIPQEGLTIDAVNTLTEEDYHNIDQSELSENAGDFYHDDDSNFYDDETVSGINHAEESSHVEDNWLSQVQMKISSYDPNISTIPENPMEQVQTSIETMPMITQIKLEPLDEMPEPVDTSIVKSEPISHLDEMTIIPENIVTKSEFLDAPISPRPPIQKQNSSSFDVDQFEAFVSTNKMMCNMNTYDNEDEEIFSQSASRIRRQYEPDSDTENDMSMSLLIPQTYEPVPIVEKNKVKDSLMESSSDETGNNKKVPPKKKSERRGRGRTKKNEPKPVNTKEMAKGKPTVATKEVAKEKPTVTNEIAMLTRRMRDKIRQEEKKAASSDSEPEPKTILTKKGKDKMKESTDKAKRSKAEVAHGKETDNDSDIVKHTKPPDDEIQCSNVDSTEQVIENISLDSRNESPSINNFGGFSADDQNEITSYQKYVKYVYDQMLPKDAEDDEQKNVDHQQPVINPEEPVELLECEPTMPFFMEESSSSSKTVKIKSRTKKYDKKKFEIPIERTEKKENLVADESQVENKLYVERHGWKCYPLDGSDTKLYQNAQILLEKLPESFVETYFQYQDVTSRNDEDDEVDRLTNLQTLNRPTTVEGVPERKYKPRPKCKIQPQVKDAVYSILGLNQTDDAELRSPSPAHSEREFTPSEDESGKVDEETPPSITKPASDNNLAKNSLMDENDSEDETKIKQEPKDADAEPSTSTEGTKPAKKYKPGPKSKKIKEQAPPAPVMLTADKMMNKELNLLHAPVSLGDENVKVKSPAKGPVTRNKQKSNSKTSPKDRIKAEDDSSSEEEKQWFTIKEKLLKRMVKKQDNTREDDAKRAKLVSEFIERRGDGTESYIKKRRGPRSRRSKKKMLERQKQRKVLNRELFGDPSNDASLQRKKQAAAYFKGRRNIRKVIDKTALAKSTVVANMEEFERKRRLNIKQSKLREVLRCEEGVNVLVINDEVCLEYDFEQHRPVVTIHPFFTKVMKAHQYEGVKFMWDACFESLESIAAGNPGGGCILAHCMGLGKTLQVLALLHTVLTHPGVGMQRVLVCCPLSTVLNWVDEIHKWIGPVSNQIKVFELSKLKKTYERAYQLEDWYNGGGIFIIGYELFRSLTTLDPYLDDVRPTIINKIRTALLDPGPDIIICDEGHLLKNDCSVLAVAMSRVTTSRRIVLTGTPMQNNLREYYCMVNFVKPNLLGTYAEYSNRFENPIMNGQHRDSREEDIKLMKARTHILHKVLEGCLQRQEASVLYPYLPKKHEYTVFISLTKCQWDLYKHYLLNYGNTQNNKSILKDFHILQKIWSHPQVLHNFQMRVCDEAKAKIKVKEEKLEDDLAREDLNETADVKPSDTEVWWLQYLDGGDMLDSLTSSNKFVAVFRILDESVSLGDKVLIFSTSLFTMDVLEFFLKKIKKWSLGQEYYRLDGSVPAEVRQKWCREFNAVDNHKTKLFLISTRAGSLGLNMTAANRVIILDTSWNPAHDIQSIFRVYRFGQKKDCYIYRLVALGTMEQKIYERSVTKQAVACRVVDEQQIDRHYNMADLTELYKYDEAGVGVAGGVAVGVEDVVLLRVARDAALHAVHEHDSLLRGSGEQGLPEHERNAAWVQFQEEHAHKQMQENALQQALLEQKLKQEANLAAPQPPKRRNYAKLKLAIKLDPSEESKPAVTTLPSAAAQSKSRGRPPKKTNVVSCCIPIQPEGADAAVTDKEMAMVKKISDILIQHNFQNHKTPEEISELVSRVRQIVSSGNMDQLDCTDRLTMSLANVFLERDTPTPALTDVAEAPGPSVVKEEPTQPKSVKNKQKGRKKGSGKKMFVYEEVPSTSAPPPPVEPDAEVSRTRRKAAIAAERNFDSTINSVIDIDDDDWQIDSNFALANNVQEPKVEEKQVETTTSRQRKSNTNSKLEKTEVIDTLKTSTGKQTDAGPVQPDSILLSDDDEPLPARKKPGSKKKNRQAKVTDAVIPLHPSLLSNKNFIKIVAHTYLSGNPMLDEDAATLAAQYSTFKALKEYESAGKEIESGPIYDIAVNVLGINVLKKLHMSNTKIVTSKIIALHPLNSKDDKPPVTVPAAPKPEGDDKKPVKLRIKIPPLPPGLAAAGRAAGRAAPAAPGSEVVPVGLFKRAEEGPSSTADECILPDDDDIHIISDSTPPAPAPLVPEPPALSTPSFGRRNSMRMLVTKVKADAAPAAPAAPRKPLVTPAAARAPPAAPPAPPAPSESILSDLTAPISLDSDDEDSGPRPALGAKPAPPPGRPLAPRPVVPVSLTQIGAPGRILRKVVVPVGSGVPPGAAAPAGGAPIVLNSAAPANFYLIDGNFAPPAPVPVALTEAQMTPLGLTQLAPVPVSLPAPAAQSSPPAPRTRAPPRTQAPPRPQPPTETTRLAGKSNKRVCKPGDIVRITETGKLEVLKRKDIPDSSSPGEAEAAETPPPKRTPAVPVVKRGVGLTATDSRNVKQKISPSFPDDPLSILRDVIHIEADSYDSNETQPPPKPPAPTKSTAGKAPIAPPSKAPTITKPQEKWHQVLTHNSPKPGTDKAVIDKNRKVDNSADSKKTAPDKTKERILGSVDLTDTDGSTYTSTASSSKKGAVLKGTTTIVGTSKSIILCGYGKAVAKASGAEKREFSSKQAEKPSAAKPKLEMKKRAAPVDTGATKKKKTDKLKMLKDFSIDDMDGIIELD